MRTPVLCLTIAAALLTASSARGDVLDIDLSGWVTHGGFFDSQNTSTTVNIGAGSQIAGAEWIDLEFTTLNGSWLSEFTLSLNDSAINNWWDSTVSATDANGNYSGSGSFPGPIEEGGPFTVADGDLYIEVYEQFNDAGSAIDASVTSGTLRITYTAVPEPAACAVLGLGGLALLRRRRLA